LYRAGLFLLSSSILVPIRISLLRNQLFFFFLTLVPVCVDVSSSSTDQQAADPTDTGLDPCLYSSIVLSEARSDPLSMEECESRRSIAAMCYRREKIDSEIVAKNNP